MAPMTEVIKGTSFIWTPKAQSAIEKIKTRLTQALVLSLSLVKSFKLNVIPLELV